MWRRNLYVAWIAQVLSLSGFGFAFPFIPFFIQELGITDPDELRVWTGLVSAAPALSMGIMAPVWGLLADRLGKKIMMLRAMLFGSIILSGLALARSVEAVLILRVIQGLFTGTMTASAALIASGTPEHRMSYALGLLSSSNFIGISLGPLLGGIASELFGYRPSFAVGAGVLGAGFVLVLLFIRDIDAPVTTGAVVGAGTAPEQKRARRRARDEIDAGRPRIRTLLTVPVLAGLVMLLLLRFSRALPVPFLPLYVQELRGRIEGSASITGFISAGRGAVTALAAVTITRLGDRHPKLRIVSILLAIATVLTLPIAFIPSLGGFSALIIVATFFLGGIEPLLQADLSSRTPPSRRGVLFGIQTTAGNIGWFAAPLLGSAISVTFGINYVFLTLAIFLGITMVISAMLYFRGTRDAR